jgi:hypothetical protein
VLPDYCREYPLAVNRLTLDFSKLRNGDRTQKAGRPRLFLQQRETDHVRQDDAG